MFKRIVVFIALIAVFYGCSSTKQVAQEASKTETNPETESQKGLEHFVDGTIAEMKGDYATAVLEFQEALETDQTAGIYYALAKNYFYLNKLSPALKNIKLAIRADSTNLEYYNLIANIYEHAHQGDSASVIYEKIISLDSSNVNAYYSLGLIYEKIKPTQALEVYKKLLEITGPEWSVLVRVADIYDRMNKPEEAVTTIEQLSAIDPSNIELKKLLIESYLKTKKYDQALTLTNEILVLFPEDKSALELQGQIYLLNNDWKKAAEAYNKLLKDKEVPHDTKIKIASAYLMQASVDSTLLPTAKSIVRDLDKDTTSWQIKMLLGDIALRERDDSTAMNAFKAVTELAKWNSEAWIRLGGLYFDKRKYEDAVDLMKQAVTSFPDDFAVNLILGLSLTQLNNYTEAIEYLRKSVELNPKDVNALSAYGFTLNQLKQPDLAIRYLTEALKLDPENVELLGTLGLIYNAQKKWDLCDSTYLRALELDSTNALVLNNYAYSLAERNIKLADALNMANKAVAKDPENPSYLDTIGWVYYQLGEYDKAEKYIKDAVKLDEKNATLLEHLGDVLFKKGDSTGAMENWQKSMNLNSDNPELQQKIQRGTL